MLEHHKSAMDIYNDGRLFLDFSKQVASLNGKPVTLSQIEYKMLHLFCKNQKQVLIRRRLLERLWEVRKQEQREFLQGIRNQTDKLEILFQALVKTSRLETRSIRLEKKEKRIFS